MSGMILDTMASEMIADHLNHPQLGRNQSLGMRMISCPRIHMRPLYDTVSDVVESKVHQCQQNSDAQQDGLILPQKFHLKPWMHSFQNI